MAAPAPLPALFGLAAGAALLAGCGEERGAVRLIEEVRSGQLTKAAATAADLRSGGNDALVREMELGMVAHLAGDRVGAGRHLDQAAVMVDDRRSGSVMGAVGSWVYNDTAKPYPGWPFEHAQVDCVRVVDHLLAAQDLDGIWRGGPPLATGLPPAPAPAPAADALAADVHRERAITFARRLTISTLKHTQDDVGGERYDDDPYGRLLAGVAVMALPKGERTASDDQFATVAFGSAYKAYEEQHKRLATGQPFRYEAPAHPGLATTLWLRQLQQYDPERFQGERARVGSTADPALPAGHGSVLVLNHVGFVTRPEPLQMGILGVGSRPPPNYDGYKVGGLAFWARGPGQEVVNSWAAIPVPGTLVQQALAPGGAAVIGFEIPVHRGDRPLGSPAALRVDGGAARGLEVVADIDAYARGTLKDAQPGIVLKTLSRTLVKQGAVAATAHAVGERREGRSDGTDPLALIVNLAGSALMTATESADLRAWLTLPDHVEGVLVDLPAGPHRLELDTRNGTVALGTVEVPAGRIAVVAVRTFTPETDLRKDPP